MRLMRMMRTILIAAAAAAACGDPAAVLAVTVHVVDEAGAPLAGARVEVAGDAVTTDAGGDARVELARGPAYALVTAPGHLVEPVPLGWEDANGVVPVTLLGDGGGRRIVIHSAGDVMFGRRYEAPPEGQPLVPRAGAGGGAAGVVSQIAPLFRAADLRTINLETVVTDRGDDAAYPGKRFILRTRPGALAGVEALAPDVVVLANNHQRDFLDDGVADTIAALDRAGLSWIGTAAADRPAVAHVTKDVRGTRVAVLAWTTVDGSFVNDSYPEDGAPIPPDVAAEDRWQYDAREWGYVGPGIDVPTTPRRIGSAWRVFAAEGQLSSSGEAWASLAGVYPELQDWVQRRGHGGAAFWDDAASVADIGAARADADVVIVQIHGGFQFQEASSKNVQTIARRAIDAGADLVVCHHPHVLQGLEWYKGKLIAYSLGNFVFDQDFLSTFASAVLRTVWDGSTLVEARLVPVELDGYRPAPVVDRAGRRTLLTLWERSVLRASADRYGAAVVPVADEPDADTRLPGFALEHGTARVTQELPAPTAVSIDVPASGVGALPDDALVDPRVGEGMSIGRDLFGWGHLDDEVADGSPAVTAHWYDLGHIYKEAMIDGGGAGYLRLQRTSTSDDSALARPVARIPLPRHRLFSAPGAPLDPAATYSVRLRARGGGDVRAHIRIDLYAFDDSDPTEDPTSVALGSSELPFTPTADWQDFDLPIAGDVFATANMALLYVVLDPPAAAKSHLDVDDLAFVEWRPAAQLPDRPGRYDWVRRDGGGAGSVMVDVYPMR